MPRFRKIYVNSAFRTSGTSTGFHYELPQDQDCGGGSGDVKCHMAITSVSIPNAFFSVMTGVNDKLYIYERNPTTESLSQNRIVVIASGNYSSTSLNSAILSGLNAAALGPAQYGSTYNSVTQRIQVTQTNGGGFVIYDDLTLKRLGRKDPNAQGLYGSLPTIANPQSLQQTLNIPPAVPPDVVWISGVITLARVTEVFLRSPNLTNMSTMDSLGRQDTIKRICLDKEFGFQCVTDSNIETSDLMEVRGTLRALDFILTDSHANQLNLHGLDFSFCMNFVYGEIDS